MEVAWPEMFSPLTVVVPNPEPEISRAEMLVVAVPATVVVEKYRLPPALRVTHPATPALSVNMVDEAMVRPGRDEMVVVPMPKYLVEVAEEPARG